MSCLRLLHLSDIHFSKASDGSFDLDIDLRNELELDVERQCSQLGPASGIFISGDVAFAGQEQDYQRARQWLTALAKRAGCPEHQVWVVPGNHDVDRASIKSSHMLQSAHRTIRITNAHQLDDELTKWATDPYAAPVLLAPLSNYNAFAQLYDCSVNVSKLSWSSDLTLNDGSILRVWGVTSALISDDLDNDGDNRLVLGRMQLALPRESGVEYLLLCHHPPDWLLDRDAAEDLLKRARIQLFGHKHQQRLIQLDDCLRITAGAVHPARTEASWEPRYNWIEVSVDSSVDGRTMRVTVHPRVWSAPNTSFGPENPEQREFSLALPPWQPRLAPGSQIELSIQSQTESGEAVSSQPPGGFVNANRRLVYRFCELSYVARIDISRTLGLLADEDRGIDDVELNRRILRRARERAQLSSLWVAVEARYPDPAQINPFA